MFYLFYYKNRMVFRFIFFEIFIGFNMDIDVYLSVYVLIFIKWIICIIFGNLMLINLNENIDV